MERAQEDMFLFTQLQQFGAKQRCTLQMEGRLPFMAYLRGDLRFIRACHVAKLDVYFALKFDSLYGRFILFDEACA